MRGVEPLMIPEFGCGGGEWPRLQGCTERVCVEDSVGTVKAEVWSCPVARRRGFGQGSGPLDGPVSKSIIMFT